jgi:hypothetical protein
MNIIKKIIYILLMISSFFGCMSDVNEIQDEIIVTMASTPTLITPLDGLGGIVGKVENAKNIWPDEDLFVYAAEFYGDIESGTGSYILETRLFPRTNLDTNGYFQLNDLKAQAYVLVVGPFPESAKPILNEEQNDALIIQVSENEIVHLGSVLLSH